MPRKSQTLEQERGELRTYYRGSDPVVRIITDVADLGDNDREWAKIKCCALKSCDYSHKYIAKACGVSVDIVVSWVNDPALKKKIGELRKDQLTGGMKYIKTLVIEAVETFADGMRNAPTHETRMKAAGEILDRVGITKVTKVVAASPAMTPEEETEQAMRAFMTASPQDVQKMAAKLGDVTAVLSEHVV